ncbi:hypothetical protein FKP32DRAFT_7586 [Trametes sanguinea]|nr:hypothetical protein FKP32DRAFT_7586 [Trametes sanguinea]
MEMLRLICLTVLVTVRVCLTSTVLHRRSLIYARRQWKAPGYRAIQVRTRDQTFSLSRHNRSFTESSTISRKRVCFDTHTPSLRALRRVIDLSLQPADTAELLGDVSAAKRARELARADLAASFPAAISYQRSKEFRYPDGNVVVVSEPRGSRHLR